jgi:hypothetical protein
MYCHKCGAQVDREAAFCARCGVKQISGGPRTGYGWVDAEVAKLDSPAATGSTAGGQSLPAGTPRTQLIEDAEVWCFPGPESSELVTHLPRGSAVNVLSDDSVPGMMRVQTAEVEG